MGLFNVLQSALTLLPPVTFQYRKFTGEFTKNELGVLVPKYTEWMTCRGMAQPVQSSKYQSMGLDFSKKYYSFWGSVVLHGMDVQEAPDQLRIGNRTFTVETDNDWVNYNGWHGVTAYEDKRERPARKADAGNPKVPEQKELPPDSEEIGKVADWRTPFDCGDRAKRGGIL